MKGKMYVVASVESALSRFTTDGNGQRIWEMPEWRVGDLAFATRREALIAGLDLLRQASRLSSFAIVHVADQLPDNGADAIAQSIPIAEHYMLGRTPCPAVIGLDRALCVVEVVGITVREASRGQELDFCMAALKVLA